MQIDLLRRLTPSATLVGELPISSLSWYRHYDRIACAQELLSHTTNETGGCGHCTAPELLRLATKPKPSLRRADRATDCMPVPDAMRKLSFTHFLFIFGEPAMSYNTLILSIQ